MNRSSAWVETTSRKLSHGSQSRGKPGNETPVESYQDFLEETVITRLERVPGVSRTGAFGGRTHEVRITFDPYKAASIGLDPDFHFQ